MLPFAVAELLVCWAAGCCLLLLAWPHELCGLLERPALTAEAAACSLLGTASWDGP